MGKCFGGLVAGTITPALAQSPNFPNNIAGRYIVLKCVTHLSLPLAKGTAGVLPARRSSRRRGGVLCLSRMLKNVAFSKR